jgi:hypothetical protein
VAVTQVTPTDCRGIALGQQLLVSAYYLDIYIEDERRAAGKKTGPGTHLHVPNPDKSIRLKFSILTALYRRATSYDTCCTVESPHAWF